MKSDKTTQCTSEAIREKDLEVLKFCISGVLTEALEQIVSYITGELFQDSQIEGEELAQQLSFSTNMVHNLINDLLDLAKLESGTF